MPPRRQTGQSDLPLNKLIIILERWPLMVKLYLNQNDMSLDAH